nr:nucleotidyltransferase domain-containing protein [Bifidobacterium longum]
MTFYVQRHTGVINQETRGLIAKRYRTVTRAINREFYDSYSEVEHSLYVGSYGRCTAVDTSDIDIMVILPREEYDHFDSYRGMDNLDCCNLLGLPLNNRILQAMCEQMAR